MTPPNGLYIQPDLRRKRITVTLSSSDTIPAQLAIDGTPYTVEARERVATLDFPEFNAWSPETPVLYSVLCNGNAGQSFGMREFTIKDNRFHLNNRPAIVRGIVCPDAEPLTEAWLASAKKSGFTFLRMSGIAAPESLLVAADVLGVMICDNVDTRDEVVLAAQIAARRHHPSIVMWSVTTRYDDPGSRESAMRAVHVLDPSRLTVCGFEDNPGPALCLRPYHEDVLKLDTVSAHLPAPSTPRGERFFENAGNPGGASMLVSYGAPEWNTDGVSLDPILEAHELTAAFANGDALTTAVKGARIETLKAQTQAARANSKLSGYCMAAFDVATAPAFAPVQTSMMLSLRAARTTLVPREEVPVTVSVVNDERIEPLADLSLQVVGPTNQVLWKKKRSVKVPKQTREIWSGTISASGSVGTHKFVVRLMQGMKLLSQNSIDLHVVEPVTPCDVELQVLDPHREWSARCMALVRVTGAKPRVYVVPPLANTIRAYPDTDLLGLLAEVKAGAVALMIGPPGDWNDLAERIDESIRATSFSAIDAFHCIRSHPVFDGLPSRCLMRSPYRNIAPRAAFEETSDESICGAIAIRNGEAVWGEDFLVRRFGAGRIVFTHLRVLDQLGADPGADRLFVNLLKHFGRRSVPSDDTPSLSQSVHDWFRRERSEHAKLWSFIGPFANWGDVGHEAVYPPEQNVDLTAVHAGWRDAVRWTRWYALGDVINQVSADEALALPFIGDAPTIPETYYAYAECNAPARQAATLQLLTHASVKVFANGALCGDYPSSDETTKQDLSIPITMKQGKNALLIKISRTRASAGFTSELTSATRDPLIIKWWR